MLFIMMYARTYVDTVGAYVGTHRYAVGEEISREGGYAPLTLICIPCHAMSCLVLQYLAMPCLTVLDLIIMTLVCPSWLHPETMKSRVRRCEVTNHARLYAYGCENLSDHHPKHPSPNLPTHTHPHTPYHTLPSLRASHPSTLPHLTPPFPRS